jgi:hypothetical protein
MPVSFSEEEVHQFLYQEGLEHLIVETPEPEETPTLQMNGPDESNFELWRIIKAKAEDKLRKIDRGVRYGEFIGSKIKLPTDKSKPMELDLLGTYEDGLFILELKVNRSAERNAFSELFAYSNYIAEMFALSGHKDITNVLVAKLDAKITKQAFLYDLLIADRNIVIYQPEFPTGSVESLRLHLYLPTDEDFQHFTNRLLSHDAMACVVASFKDIPGWIDSGKAGGEPPDYTLENLESIGSYAAQLMEAENLHGFCFMRKRWAEIPMYYENALIVCAVNPFELVDPERSVSVVEQLDQERISDLFEFPKHAFHGRLLSLALRVLDHSLESGTGTELENPLWSEMVTSMIEVVFTHNIAFHPTGLLREAYVSDLSATYQSEYAEDLSPLRIKEVTNWFRAWSFMERCGFTSTENETEEGEQLDEFF